MKTEILPKEKTKLAQNPDFLGKKRQNHSYYKQ